MDMLIEEIRAHIPILFEPIDVSTMEEVDYTQLYKENTEEICVGKLSIIPPWFNQRPPDRDYLLLLSPVRLLVQVDMRRHEVVYSL